jgi:hypothetical protein
MVPENPYFYKPYLATCLRRGQLRRGDLVTLYLDQRGGLLNHNPRVLENVRTVSPASESEIRNGFAKPLFAGDMVS